MLPAEISAPACLPKSASTLVTSASRVMESDERTPRLPLLLEMGKDHFQSVECEMRLKHPRIQYEAVRLPGRSGTEMSAPVPPAARPSAPAVQRLVLSRSTLAPPPAAFFGRFAGQPADQLRRPPLRLACSHLRPWQYLTDRMPAPGCPITGRPVNTTTSPVTHSNSKPRPFGLPRRTSSPAATFARAEPKSVKVGGRGPAAPRWSRGRARSEPEEMS